jgi:hypothetical protein
MLLLLLLLLLFLLLLLPLLLLLLLLFLFVIVALLLLLVVAVVILIVAVVAVVKADWALAHMWCCVWLCVRAVGIQRRWRAFTSLSTTRALLGLFLFEAVYLS